MTQQKLALASEQQWFQCRSYAHSLLGTVYITCNALILETDFLHGLHFLELTTASDTWLPDLISVQKPGYLATPGPHRGTVGMVVAPGQRLCQLLPIILFPQLVPAAQRLVLTDGCILSPAAINASEICTVISTTKCSESLTLRYLVAVPLTKDISVWRHHSGVACGSPWGNKLHYTVTIKKKRGEALL